MKESQKGFGYNNFAQLGTGDEEIKVTIPKEMVDNQIEMICCGNQHNFIETK